MKRLLLFAVSAILLSTAALVSAQNIRVKCGSFTMNVPSSDVHCYQTDDNIPVPLDAQPEEIAKAQTANTAIFFSDMSNISTEIEPRVTFYLIDNLGKTSFSLMDPALNLSDILGNLASGDMAISSVNNAMPFLPYQTKPQSVTVLPALLLFEGGSGIRTVTSFTDQQLFANGNTSNLYYSWQGLSNDGRYYISAVFPLRSVSLDGKPVNDVDWEHYDGSDLQPSLEQLDFYIRSIVIE